MQVRLMSQVPAFKEVTDCVEVIPQVAAMLVLCDGIRV